MRTTNGLHGAYLESAELKAIGDRSFLVGKVVAGSDYWVTREGKMMWVALNDVIAVTEFQSLDELKGVEKIELERYQDAKRKSSQKSEESSNTDSN